MLMRLMSKGEYLIVPKGTKFTGAGKLGLITYLFQDPLVEKLLQLLIAIIDAELLIAIQRKVLKPSDV